MITPFWTWFRKGHGQSRAGFRNLLNKKLAIHAMIAILMLNLIKITPFEAAGKVLFPAASILVSMAVAWTSRAATILQDKSFRDTVIGNENPLEAYVYSYQLSLLIIITMVSVVFIMAVGGFDFYIYSREWSVRSSGFTLYFLLSLSVSECWAVIDFSNLLTLLNDKASKSRNNSNNL